MSHPKGTYLGGIRTLEDLRQRCYCDEVTGCWHWRLCFIQGAASVHFVAPDTGEKVRVRGRRAAKWLEKGKRPQPGRLVVAGCSSEDCVNPAHAKVVTLKQHGIAQRGKRPARPQERDRKLSVATVLAIRAGTDSDAVWAKRLGVSRSVIWQARLGMTFRYVPPAPPSIFGSAP